MLDTLPLVVDLNEKLVRAPCTKVGEHNLIAACNSLSCPTLAALIVLKLLKVVDYLLLLYSYNFRSMQQMLLTIFNNRSLIIISCDLYYRACSTKFVPPWY